VGTAEAVDESRQTQPVDLTRPRDLGALLSTTFELYGRFPLVFAAIAFGVVVPVNFLLLGVFSGWLTGNYAETGGIDSSIALAAGYLITVPLITGMHVRAVEQVGSGIRPSLRTVFSSGSAVFLALMLTILLQFFILVGAFIALIIPSIFLAVRFYVTPQVVVVEGLKGWPAIKRSYDLTKDNWWRLLGITIVIAIIGGVAAGIFSIPGQLLAHSQDSAAIQLFSGMIANAITYSVTALTGTLIFFDLRARQAGIPPLGWGYQQPPPPPPPAYDPPPPPGGYAPPPPGYHPPAPPQPPLWEPPAPPPPEAPR
jgi:hypothetical protein